MCPRRTRKTWGPPSMRRSVNDKKNGASPNSLVGPMTPILDSRFLLSGTHGSNKHQDCSSVHLHILKNWSCHGYDFNLLGGFASPKLDQC